MPRVLDPFAGGGAIPLEALRLGCESYAIDLNPVAHLIELCTLVYPQKYGHPDSRPVPDYIKRLIAHNRAKWKARGEANLFDRDDGVTAKDDEHIIPGVEITEAEYRRNPLAADVKYWSHWVLDRSKHEIGRVYPVDEYGGIPVAYLWARTVICSNPSCRATIPLVRTLCLSQKKGNEAKVRILLDDVSRCCNFEVVNGKASTHMPDDGTVQQGRAACPFCQTVLSGDTMRAESKAGRMGEQLMAVVTMRRGERGKFYRSPNKLDEQAFVYANDALQHYNQLLGPAAIPNEPITPDRPSLNSRGLSAVVRYGFDDFGKLFNSRQKLALLSLAYHVREAVTRIRDFWDDTYAKAVGTYVGFLVDKHADHNSGFQRWHNGNQQMTNTFSRQALQMMWDYCEANPFSHSTGSATGSLDDILACPPLKYPIAASDIAKVVQGTATAISIEDNKVAAVITDPPYYDSVPYGDLSDFFYVWMKRALGALYPELFRTPLTPKQQELIAYYGSGERKIQKTPEWYEKGMNNAFSEIHRILDQNGIACVMFAHKTTTAWEAIIAALLSSGLTVTASWPLHTEMKTRMVAQNAAALASSVTLVCRKRQENAGNGYWDDVRQELKQVVQENLDFFWSQGIRGADFFISAIGPALSVLGKYERVTNYALTKILRTTHTVAIDPESRFYIVWQWSYGDAQVPADESFKLSQALGMHTEEMWDRTGVLEKSGENVQAVPIIKRMRVKNLGEPTADGAPASLIDVLHRMCAFREKGDTQGMAQFLGQSGDANNPTLWLVAQAISEILPDGDKEKQLMQGLLNQREGLEEATRQRTLF
jgi:putative DNA methylase